MQTLKDAEQKIKKLEFELAEVRSLIRRIPDNVFNSESTPIKPQEVVQSTAGVVDYIVTAAGNTILHNLLHIFNLFKAKHIDAESLDLRNGGNVPQLHISHEDSEEGIYVMDLAGASYFARNAYWDGTNWKAKDTTALLLSFNESTGFVFSTATGLSVGANISFIQILSFTMAGAGILPLLTATRPLKLNGSKNIISSQIALNSSNDITGVLGLANGGTNGTDAATARTSLDVYSKSETISEITTQLASLLPTITVSTEPDHNHAETGTTTSSDGSHSHTLSI